MNFKPAQLVVASIAALVATEARADAPERSPVAIGAATASPLTFARGKTSSGWLPFEYVAGTRIFVRTTVNGRSVLAMLDSGASSTVLDRRFAASLGLSAKGDLTGQGAGGSTPYGVIQGVTVKLGDLSWTGGDAVAIDLSAVEKQVGHPLPMVLGGELFRDAVVEIDFKNRRIAFHNPSSYRAAPNARAVALTPAGENQAISVLVEGRAAKLLFDLGNAGAVDLFPGFWEQPGFDDNRRTSTTFAGGVGGMSVQKVTMLRTIALGGATFEELPSRLEDRQSSLAARSGDLDGNIGMGVLSPFHLVVDFPHHRVLFAPPVDVTTPFRVNHGGLTLQAGPSGSKVLYVAPGSPSAIAGVAVGNVIVAVDGRSAGGQNGTWQDGPVGRTVRLRLADGQEKTVTLARYF
ncbi:retropepsin-like aspartic protease [Sphingomonas sp. NFR15]|uniref:retropepsin-like aspartic protease n=1 Tax=Sphingomonas sp. NFR15 TaxID=1566282 RepID=UPI00087F245E|nr:aspartyl protease family protein [Sphingomonas sp. NFR15]SDA35856.1 Aspartyl protease [Sphingomonas sp. NFR15]